MVQLSLSSRSYKNYTIIELHGDLNATTLIKFRDYLTPWFKEPGNDHLALDFAHLENLDSSGVTLLTNLIKKIKHYCIFNCKPEIFEIFDMVNFQQIMTFYDTEEDFKNSV